jgi:sugar phosphate permease
VFGLSLGAAASSCSIATLSGVHPCDAGLASGLNNTFECIFGALGTALMVSVAVTHTTGLLHSGASALPALNDGFKLAFAFAVAVAIAFPAIGLLASIMLGPATARERPHNSSRRRPAQTTRPHEPEPP